MHQAMADMLRHPVECSTRQLIAGTAAWLDMPLIVLILE